jgi:acetyl esterase/lipase
MTRPTRATGNESALDIGNEGDLVAQWSRLGEQRIVRNVARPLLLPVLPPAGRGDGRAVVIAPGGAYRFLSIDSEGLGVARRLADVGVAAFVLAYRVDATPRDDAAFDLEVARWFARPVPLVGPPDALADARAAMRAVRDRAAAWSIDASRVGFLGFSAGAHLARGLVAAPRDERPDSLSLLYGPLDPMPVPADAPPLFVAMAMDDPLFGDRGLGLVDAWRAARRPVELHLYEHGGHGFGLRPQGASSDRWIEHWIDWLARR